MAHIAFDSFGVCNDLSERTKSDGTKYAVIEIGYSLWGQPGKWFTAKLMCFTPAIYNALQLEMAYRFKGIVTFLRGNTFLTITEVYDEQGNSVYIVPDEHDYIGEVQAKEIS